MTWKIDLPLDPIPCPRPKVSRYGGAYYPAKYSRWKAAAAKLLPACLFNAGIVRELAGPLIVSLVLRVTRPKASKLTHPKPDVDNYAKSVMDACNGLAWEDDSQVVRLEVSKEWAPPGEPGSVEVVISRPE